MDVTTDWFWEGNVVGAIARALEQGGWDIVGKADTRSKERGVDIHAIRNGRTLLVEAKGYPSKSYPPIWRRARTKDGASGTSE